MSRDFNIKMASVELSFCAEKTTARKVNISLLCIPIPLPVLGPLALDLVLSPIGGLQIRCHRCPPRILASRIAAQRMATPTANPPTVWASTLPRNPEKAVVKILTVISQAIAPLCYTVL